MKGRVEFVEKGVTDFIFNWDKHVREPANNWYFIEAFGSADALIDDSLEFLLKSVYSDSKSQELINGLMSLRGKTNFYGLRIAEILKANNIIDKDLFEQLKIWKTARNTVAHNKYAEYGLVVTKSGFSYNSQEELDKLVKDKSNELLELAHKIDLKLAMCIPK